jgi:transposase-like protein
MKYSILSQISELKESDKLRLYKVIEGFLFDNDVDISKEQTKEKIANANNCPYCKSTRTRKNGHQYGVQRFVCNDCKKNFRVSTGSVTAQNQSPLKKTITLIATSFTAWHEFKDIANLSYIY